MELRRDSFRWLVFSVAALALPLGGLAQTSSSAPSPSPSSSSAKHVQKPAVPTQSGIDAGAVSDGVYRNKSLGLTCKIPAGWILRTDEMNAREEDAGSPPPAAETTKPLGAGGRVLLAAFSRPPEARGEDVNASIVIAAENVATYPGLKEAVQYFGPLTEVVKAQGFAMDEEPYEIAVGTKTLVRGDFHQNVGTRVRRQSTLVMLARGYAVSFTVIGGTDDEVEELIEGLDFQGPARVSPAPK